MSEILSLDRNLAHQTLVHEQGMLDGAAQTDILDRSARGSGAEVTIFFTDTNKLMADQAPEIGADVAPRITTQNTTINQRGSGMSVLENVTSPTPTIPSSTGRELHPPHTAHHHMDATSKIPTHKTASEEIAAADKILSELKEYADASPSIDEQHTAMLAEAKDRSEFHATDPSPLGHEQRTHERDTPDFVASDPRVIARVGSNSAWSSGERHHSKKGRPFNRAKHKNT